MESKSPLDTLPPALSQPLEDAANEKTDSTGMKVSEENDQPGVVEVSPPTDEEASSDDDGPEDCVRTGKAKTRGAGADPPPKKGSPKPKSPSQSEQRICPFCRQWPIVGNFEFCSEKCEKAAGVAKRKAIFRVLKPFDPKDRIAQAIYHKFCQEWNDPTGALKAPDVHAIYQISLPYYEDRFLDAIYKAQAHGGSNTKSAWFACQSICDVGVKSDDLCNMRACGICMAIKSGFDELAFGKATNNGVYGDGIYAHQNPAVAHRFTVRKSEHNFRVVILCSIVELEPNAPVANILDYGAHIDGDGRVFCAKKDVIIPRRLVVYSVKPPAEGPNMDLSTD